MSRRRNKQIIIALVFFLILSVVGFLIYYFSQPAPTCDDNIQNQGEEEVDCGGPCSACELVHIKALEVEWVKVVSGQDNFYDLAAQIKNPNQNYGSGQISYQFELYDNQDNLIIKYPGETFILPNQTKYLLKIKAESGEPIKRVNLSFGQIKWHKPKDYQFPQLVVQQKEYHLLDSQEAGFAQVRAILINKASFDFNKTDIDILLFDSNYHLLALNTNEIRILLSGQEREFFSTWFSPIFGQVSFIEIEAETNIFDLDNFLSGGREKEKFQEY